jgi:predicted RNA-binding Zn-ribbon protein involved in translation (DUF1610 family)
MSILAGVMAGLKRQPRGIEGPTFSCPSCSFEVAVGSMPRKVGCPRCGLIWDPRERARRLRTERGAKP